MKTAVFTDVGKIEIQEAPDPVVTENKILIKVESVAICTWEQRVYTGVKKVDFPFIGGHEIAGEIVAIGNSVSDNWNIGDKVVYGTNLACGDCHFCKINEEQNCLHFNHSKHLEGLPYPGMGGFSELLLVEPKHIFKYSNISSNEATITEPLSCVLHSVKSSQIEYGDVVVVVGCGIMGQLHIRLAAKSGAMVIASDLQDDRLLMAQKSGAQHVINSGTESLYDKVMEITDGLGANIVYDTTPISAVAEESVELLSQLGTLVLYSSFYPDKPISISPDTLHKKATRIIGTANSNSKDFVQSSSLLSYGIINVDDFISETYPFIEINEAMESAIKGDKYRVVLEF